ncbi:MAG TPA: alpha/beta family hydrolase [Actinomycetota bacterium]
MIWDLPDQASPTSGAATTGALLTHGAGGDSRGPGLGALARGLAALGHPVGRFDLPYRVAGRRTPPEAERSVPAFANALAEARSTYPGVAAWAAGGKSYGGRVASLAVAGGLDAAALVFYGYPLHPPGRPERLRVGHWPSIRVPCLFLQGTADPFCDLDLLREHLPSLGAPATLEVVEGGGHSLEVAASRSPDGQARSAPEVLGALAPVVAAWLAAHESRFTP